MHSAATERLEFAPPPIKGSLRALALALVVHLLLIAALTWGVNWKQAEEEAGSFEAELWNTSVQQATSPVKPTPAPSEPDPVPPAPVEAPLPAPLPPVEAPEVKLAPAQPDADIALEKENEKKRQRQKEAERQQAKQLQEKQQAELQAKQDQERQKKKEKDLKAQQELAQRKTLEQAEKANEKKQQAKALEKEQLAAEADKKKQAAAAEKRHQDAVKRMMGMAGSAGAGSSPKGPSASYAGRVKARVLPNVVFTEDITGNPKAEVQVSTTADGTIMSQRLVKSSGNQAWDDAVIKAIMRTGSLPRDVDGRVPTPMIIVFQPRN